MGGIDSLNRTGKGQGQRRGSSKYASERYDPNVPPCGVLAITFDGQHLRLHAGDFIYSYVAASGKPIGSGFDYSLDRQRQPNVGPIPAGTYWINPDELWENAWYKPASSSAWGNYRITLHPNPSTETHGRGGFFIHGGDTLGSAGCIDLAASMDAFIKRLRARLGTSRVCHIPVTVTYPSSR